MKVNHPSVSPMPRFPLALAAARTGPIDSGRKPFADNGFGEIAAHDDGMAPVDDRVRR
jgi:hypothetical protein